MTIERNLLSIVFNKSKGVQIPDFVRKGRAALEAATNSNNTRSSGGGRWAPVIRWRENNEKKFVLVLTPAEDITAVNIHEWIKVGTRQTAAGLKPQYETFLSRKDPLLGEEYDDLEDRLNVLPRTRFVGVVVELEPQMAAKGNRSRPNAFTVSTRSYTSRATEEEVTVPNVGLVVQSASLFWKPLVDLDEELGNLIEIPLSITRSGTSKDTHYNILPFMDVPVDLSPLVEYAKNISYISDSFEQAPSDPQELASYVSEQLMTAYLSELMDKSRYEQMVGPLQSIDSPFPRRGTEQREPSRTEEAPASQPSKQFEELKAKLASARSSA